MRFIRINYVNQSHDLVGTQALHSNAVYLRDLFLNLPSGYRYRDKRGLRRKINGNNIVIHLVGCNVHYKVALPAVCYADGHKVRQFMAHILLSGKVGDVSKLSLQNAPHVPGYKLQKLTYLPKVRFSVSQYSFVGDQPTLQYNAQKVSNVVVKYINQNHKLVSTSRLSSTLDCNVDFSSLELPSGYDLVTHHFPHIKMSLTKRIVEIRVVGKLVHFNVPLDLTLKSRNSVEHKLSTSHVSGHVGDVARIDASSYPNISGYSLIDSPQLAVHLTEASYVPLSSQSWHHNKIVLNYRAHSCPAVVNFVNQNGDTVHSIHLNTVVNDKVDLSLHNHIISVNVPKGYIYGSTDNINPVVSLKSHHFEIEVVGRSVSRSVNVKCKLFINGLGHLQRSTIETLPVEGRVGDIVDIKTSMLPKIKGYKLVPFPHKSVYITDSSYKWHTAELIAKYSAVKAAPLKVDYVNQVGNTILTKNIVGYYSQMISYDHLKSYVPNGYHTLSHFSIHSYMLSLKPQHALIYVVGEIVHYTVKLRQLLDSGTRDVEFNVSGRVGAKVSIYANQLKIPQGYYLSHKHIVKMLLTSHDVKFLTKPVFKYQPRSASVLVRYLDSNNRLVFQHTVYGIVGDNIDLSVHSKFQSQYLPFGYKYSVSRNSEYSNMPLVLASNMKPVNLYVVGNKISRHINVMAELIHNKRKNSECELDTVISGRVGSVTVFHSSALSVPSGYRLVHKADYKVRLLPRGFAWIGSKPVIKFQPVEQHNVLVRYVNQNNHVVDKHYLTGYTGDVVQLGDLSLFNARHLPTGYVYDSNHLQAKSVQISDAKQMVNVYVRGKEVHYPAKLSISKVFLDHVSTESLRLVLSGYVGDDKYVHPNELMCPSGFSLSSSKPIKAVLGPSSFKWVNNKRPVVRYYDKHVQGVLLVFETSDNDVLSRHFLRSSVGSELDLSPTGDICKRYLPQGYELIGSQNDISDYRVLKGHHAVHILVQGKRKQVNVKFIQVLFSPNHLLLGSQFITAGLASRIGSVKSIPVSALPIPGGYKCVSKGKLSIKFTDNGYVWLHGDGHVMYVSQMNRQLNLNYSNRHDKVVSSCYLPVYNDETLSLAPSSSINLKHVPHDYHVCDDATHYKTIDSTVHSVGLPVRGDWVTRRLTISYTKQNADGSKLNGIDTQSVLIHGQVGSVVDMSLRDFKHVPGYTLMISKMPKVLITSFGYKLLGHKFILNYRANVSRILVNYVNSINGKVVTESYALGHTGDVLDLSQNSSFNSRYLPYGYEYNREIENTKSLTFSSKLQHATVHVLGTKVSRKVSIKIMKLSHDLKHMDNLVSTHLIMNGYVGDKLHISLIRLPRVAGYRIMSVPNTDVILQSKGYKLVGESPIAKYQQTNDNYLTVKYVNKAGSIVHNASVKGALNQAVDLTDNSKFNHDNMPQGYQFVSTTVPNDVARLKAQPSIAIIHVDGKVVSDKLPIQVRLGNHKANSVDVSVSGRVGSTVSLPESVFPTYRNYKLRQVSADKASFTVDGASWAVKTPVARYELVVNSHVKLQFVHGSKIVAAKMLSLHVGSDLALGPSNLKLTKLLPQGYVIKDADKSVEVTDKPQTIQVSVLGKKCLVVTSLRLAYYNVSGALIRKSSHMVTISGRYGNIVTVNAPKFKGYSIMGVSQWQAKIMGHHVMWMHVSKFPVVKYQQIDKLHKLVHAKVIDVSTGSLKRNSSVRVDRKIGFQRADAGRLVPSGYKLSQVEPSGAGYMIYVLPIVSDSGTSNATSNSLRRSDVVSSSSSSSSNSSNSSSSFSDSTSTSNSPSSVSMTSSLHSSKAPKSVSASSNSSNDSDLIHPVRTFRRLFERSHTKQKSSQRTSIQYRHIVILKSVTLYQDSALTKPLRSISPLEHLTLPVLHIYPQFVEIGLYDKNTSHKNVIGYMKNSTRLFTKAYYDKSQWAHSSKRFKIVNPSGAHVYTLIDGGLKSVYVASYQTVFNSFQFKQIDKDVAAFVIGKDILVVANRNFVKLL